MTGLDQVSTQNRKRSCRDHPRSQSWNHLFSLFTGVEAVAVSAIGTDSEVPQLEGIDHKRWPLQGTGSVNTLRSGRYAEMAEK